MALADLVAEESAALSSAENAAARSATDQSASPYAYISRIQLECKDGDEIMRAITSMVQSRIDLMKLFEPPQMNSEDAQKLLRSVVIANPDAPKLTAEFSVRYPTKDGSRTDVQMMLLVPRDEITPAEVAGAEVYTIDVVGEVLRNGKLWEKYRYRFDFPGDVDGEKLPIVIDRLLRPADYVSRIKVIDANTGAEAVVESNLERAGDLPARAASRRRRSRPTPAVAPAEERDAAEGRVRPSARRACASCRRARRSSAASRPSRRSITGDGDQGRRVLARRPEDRRAPRAAVLARSRLRRSCRTRGASARWRSTRRTSRSPATRSS